jgi:CheY-like chemotaxis protein
VSLNQDSRIFVVDDEQVSASTLSAILQKSGFSARFFTCPREALAAARSGVPDLLTCRVVDERSKPKECVKRTIICTFSN